MAELYPLPLGLHLKRIINELRRQQQIYDLPLNKFWKPTALVSDLAVEFHGRPAATALGPAAGPQDQLIQNIILSWLGGCRIVELKTVQIMDELKITRPCIYAGNVGYNVEWSQELKIPQSLTEYVAASMLIDILIHEDVLGFGADKEKAGHTIFDLSVGYDLKGISSPAVRGFIDATIDAQATIEQLKSEIPDEYRRFRDIPFTTPQIGNSITLSTFPRLSQGRDRVDLPLLDHRSWCQHGHQAQPDPARPALPGEPAARQDGLQKPSGESQGLGDLAVAG